MKLMSSWTSFLFNLNLNGKLYIRLDRKMEISSSLPGNRWQRMTFFMTLFLIKEYWICRYLLRLVKFIRIR